MSQLNQLCNIGPTIEKQLIQVGIHSYKDLVSVGSCEAWLKIKAIDPSACINKLMSLEGAIQMVRWHVLPPEDKRRLKNFYQHNQSK